MWRAEPKHLPQACKEEGAAEGGETFPWSKSGINGSDLSRITMVGGGGREGGEDTYSKGAEISVMAIGGARFRQPKIANMTRPKSNIREAGKYISG
jgi:hypothetical protein